MSIEKNFKKYLRETMSQPKYDHLIEDTFQLVLEHLNNSYMNDFTQYLEKFTELNDKEKQSIIFYVKDKLVPNINIFVTKLKNDARKGYSIKGW